jgi:uncharacterized protein YhfF
MTTNPTIDAFWQAYLASLPAGAERPTTYQAWGFGDGPDMADDLGHLVKTGVKTATCSLLWEYEADGEPVPQVGDFSVILDGAGQPLCVIETIELEPKPYNQVEAQFAYDEGEGDRSLTYWREVHWQFFSRSCARIGREISETMPLLGERFRVVFTG